MDQHKSALWEAYETHLVVCPGLSWEEWQEKWAAVDQTHRAILWWVGDALIYAEDNFGDQWAQAVDAQYADQHRNAMWVSRQIPVSERVAGLSWSAHRETASLGAEERREILAMAKREGWGARQIAAERKRRKEAAANYPRNGAPAENDLCSTVEQDEGRETDAETAPLNGHEEPQGEASSATEDAPATQPSEVRPSSPAASVEALRGCIEGARKLAQPLALGEAPTMGVFGELGGIGEAVGKPVSASVLTEAMAALDLIPDEWNGSIRIEIGEKVFGGRKTTVELKRANAIAVAVGPWLPITILEAALSARISDIEGGRHGL